MDSKYKPPPLVMNDVSGYQPAPAAMAGQQECINMNEVEITQPQPTPAPELIVARRKPPDNPFFLVFSTVLLVLCCLQLCLPALLCVVPGLVFAVKGRNKLRIDDRSSAEQFNIASLVCNIISIVYYVLTGLYTIISFGVYYIILAQLYTASSSELEL